VGEIVFARATSESAAWKKVRQWGLLVNWTVFWSGTFCPTMFVLHIVRAGRRNKQLMKHSYAMYSPLNCICPSAVCIFLNLCMH